METEATRESIKKDFRNIFSRICVHDDVCVPGEVPLAQVGRRKAGEGIRKQQQEEQGGQQVNKKTTCFEFRYMEKS